MRVTTAIVAALCGLLSSTAALHAQPMPACDLDGTWQYIGGAGESWNFSQRGPDRYTAREQGHGNATGFAVVEGRNFRIDYVVNNGDVTGVFRMRFTRDCDAAHGTWRARHRDGGWPYSTPDRGDVGLRRVD